MFDDESIGFQQLQRNQGDFDYGLNLSPESIPELNPMTLEDMPVSISIFDDDELLSGWNSLRPEQPTKIRRKERKNVVNLKETKPMILRPFESCQATEISVIYLRMWSNQMFEKKVDKNPEDIPSG